MKKEFTPPQRPTDREIDRVLEWAEKYVGCGIAQGVYAHTAVPAERALDYIADMRKRLKGEQVAPQPDLFLEAA